MPRSASDSPALALLFGVLLTLSVASRPLIAQTAYATANVPTSIIPPEHGFFTIDFAEVKLGLTFARSVELPCGGSECVSDRLEFTLHTSGAARKGERSLFTGVGFNPGYDIGAGIAWVMRGSGQARDVVYLRTTLARQERDVIAFEALAGTSDSVFTLSEPSQRTFGAALGFNHAFTSVTVLGVGFEARRERSSPGVQLPREYCTPGRSVQGYRVPVCSDRYVAPLSDLWVVQARIDLMLGLTAMGSRIDAPRLGLIGAVSADFTEGANHAVNLALGPSIHIDGYPGQAVVALLFGVRDAFDANGLPAGDPERGSWWSEHFVVRLPVSVPFKVLLSR